MGLLDRRSRTTTAAERAELYTLKNPTEDLVFGVVTYHATCAHCDKTIGPMSIVWLRDVSGDPEYVELAKTDPSYNENVGKIQIPVCAACFRAAYRERIHDYMNERRQCEREERLEEAVRAEAAGKLEPRHWVEIMIANLGYVDPREVRKTIDEMICDFAERFSAGTTHQESIRAELWSRIG